MPSSRRPHNELPPRPKTAVDYVPTHPHATVHPYEAHYRLLNESQKRDNIHAVHTISRDRFRNPNQLSVPSQAPTGRLSLDSRKSSFKVARDALAKGLKGGKEALTKTKPVVQAAASATKKVVTATANNLKPPRTSDGAKIPKTNVKGPDGRPMSRTSSNSTLYAKALYDAKRLPKLKIPDLHEAVEKALNSACSTDTTASDGFAYAEMSPTSKDLKLEAMCGSGTHRDPDVTAEFRNMLSARRRVRKSKFFGAEVGRYCLARPTWDQPWSFLRSPNDNFDDRATLKALTDALQEQKDHATRLVQRHPGRYPGMRHVSDPGCTRTMYWQHKSTLK
ncbi:hypothetical protein F5Y17DRAFT_434358 [Xylariaceae sp. FL0594]|nr:hypothetical protein F5Y17DRAFT_434358 [Xylariaceae sp. FL0594]